MMKESIICNAKKAGTNSNPVSPLTNTKKNHHFLKYDYMLVSCYLKVITSMSVSGFSTLFIAANRYIH